jgi:hypothetical protein
MVFEGLIVDGEVLLERMMTVDAAKSVCRQLPGCEGFYHEGVCNEGDAKTKEVKIFFKNSSNIRISGPQDMKYTAYLMREATAPNSPKSQKSPVKSPAKSPLRLPDVKAESALSPYTGKPSAMKSPSRFPAQYESPHSQISPNFEKQSQPPLSLPPIATIPGTISEEPPANHFIAVKDFDPGVTGWPFGPKYKPFGPKLNYEPLPFRKGQHIEVVQIFGGSKWSYGLIRGSEVKQGLFPMSLVTAMAKYQDSMAAMQKRMSPSMKNAMNSGSLAAVEAPEIAQPQTEVSKDQDGWMVLNGKISAGGDLLAQTMTVTEAKLKCAELAKGEGGCEGFYHSGALTNEPRMMFFKSQSSTHISGPRQKKYTTYLMPKVNENAALEQSQDPRWSGERNENAALEQSQDPRWSGAKVYGELRLAPEDPSDQELLEE